MKGARIAWVEARARDDNGIQGPALEPLYITFEEPDKYDIDGYDKVVVIPIEED
jgi:hypothetical protein